MENNYFKKTLIVIITIVISAFFIQNKVMAHCDTEDGPVIGDAKKAIDNNNVNYVLKWVSNDDEKELTDAFNLAMKVRNYSPEAKKLSEKYFFETLVRLHRSGEGVPYTGVKPSGTHIDEKILAADKSIQTGNLEPLSGMVPENRKTELQKLFNEVMLHKNYDVNDVNSGREYVESYVKFFHYAEGEKELNEHGHTDNKTSAHFTHIPWILAGFFLITTLIFGILYYKRT